MLLRGKDPDMLDYTSRYAKYSEYDRQAEARELLDSDDSILHVVIAYEDSLHDDIPVFLIFDDQEEWDRWVEIYQYLGGHVTAYHTRNSIY